MIIDFTFSSVSASSFSEKYMVTEPPLYFPFYPSTAIRHLLYVFLHTGSFLSGNLQSLDPNHKGAADTANSHRWVISVTSFACNLVRILHNLLFLRANRESRVTATASISPLRTARSRENKPGRQKELALAHSQLWPTIQYPLQLAHSRSSFS